MLTDTNAKEKSLSKKYNEEVDLYQSRKLAIIPNDTTLSLAAKSDEPSQGEYRTGVEGRSYAGKRKFTTVHKMRLPPLFYRVKDSVTFLTNKVTVNTLVVAPKDVDSPLFSQISINCTGVTGRNPGY